MQHNYVHELFNKFVCLLIQILYSLSIHEKSLKIVIIMNYSIANCRVENYANKMIGITLIRTHIIYVFELVIYIDISFLMYVKRHNGFCTIIHNVCGTVIH